VGWLLSRRLDESPELRQVMRGAMPTLLGAEQLHLVERAEEVARERGWHPEADLLRGRAVDLARTRAVQLRSMGASAARQGNHARALELLRRALRLAPADRLTLETVVEVAARGEDQGALQEARRLYLTLGESPEYVAALAERARTLGLGHLDAPEPTGE
jgi:tetratricopeptide (TPR) repeat protein